MRYYDLEDKQKLDIVNRKILKICNIISVVNDAMEYRIENGDFDFKDCFEFLKNLQYEVKCIDKLF